LDDIFRRIITLLNECSCQFCSNSYIWRCTQARENGDYRFALWHKQRILKIDSENKRINETIYIYFYNLMEECFATLSRARRVNLSSRIRRPSQPGARIMPPSA
jgi:exoribonuclease II